MACLDLFWLALICVRAALAISSYQAYLNESNVFLNESDVFLNESNVLPFGEQSDEDEILTTKSIPGCLFPWDCRDVQKCGNKKSGVYRVFPFGIGKGFLAYCDLVTDGGGWLVFQRRQDGSVNFYRKWKDYTNGFGNLYGEFWLGLDKIHLLTSQYHTQLMVDLVKFDGKSGYAKYDRFRVSDKKEKYRLMVGKYTGNIGNSLDYHNSQQFSTFDNDNDKWTSNCAVRDHGAWWYGSCSYSNLNGEYVYKDGKSSSITSSVFWYYWAENHEQSQFTEMKIRPAEISPVTS